MEQKAYKLLHDAEGSWWYRGRTTVVRGILGHIKRDSMNMLDFGAGFGGMYEVLAEHGTVFAYEPDTHARVTAQRKGYKVVFDDAGQAFSQKYDLIGIFDVLEHIHDDLECLENMQTALTKTGSLVITVPAMPFLWSTHDVSHHHFRRYTRTTLRRVLEEAGYAIEFISYWNMFLFTPTALARLLGHSGESSIRLSRAIDTMFYMVIFIEVFLMRFFPLPFGVSLVAVARKKT